MTAGKGMVLTPILLAALAAAGCASQRHVSPQVFGEQLELAQTCHYSEFAGISNGCAYLVHYRMPLFGGEWPRQVWYTETNALPARLLQQLQAAPRKDFRPAFP